ncbi:MAG: Uma2 family endonuclease [Acidobacteriota bacterium]|nr:Uma2 family endonuclease [Acidobacteriota bacterium]
MAVSTQTVPQTISPPLTSEFIWRLSVEQYHKMIVADILTEDDPIELLEGILVTKMPKNPPHSLVTQLVRDALARLISLGWCVNAQEPITLVDSEPEPDVAVVRGERRHYAKRHPGAQETALVVEVAHTTLSRDRGLKKRVYATAGVPTYWIINLKDRRIEVYSEPSGSDYQRRQDYDADAEVPVILDGQEVGRLAVRELLP